MVNELEFQFRDPSSFPGWGGNNLLFDVDIVNLSLKKEWRRDRRFHWSALIVSGQLVVVSIFRAG